MERTGRIKSVIEVNHNNELNSETKN